MSLNKNYKAHVSTKLDKVGDNAIINENYKYLPNNEKTVATLKSFKTFGFERCVDWLASIDMPVIIFQKYLINSKRQAYQIIIEKYFKINDWYNIFLCRFLC